MKIDKLIPEADRNVLDRIESAYARGDCHQAAKLTGQRLDEGHIDISSPRGALLAVRLACLLIDASAATFSLNDAIRGLYLLEECRAVLDSLITQANYEYNLANAKHTIFNIHRNTRSFRYRPETIDLLTQAKDHYWKAFKLMDSGERGPRAELLVNLGTVLSESGRVAEAIRCYDEVLEQDPGFPQANGCRAQDLVWLNSLSGSYSQMLLMQAHQGFSVSLEAGVLPSPYRESQQASLAQIETVLGEHGVSDVNGSLAKHAAAERDWLLQPHEAFWLRHGLYLNEHGIYCKCPVACRDDIAFKVAGRSTPEAVRLGLVLNRIKAEFAYARAAHWRAIEAEAHGLDGLEWPQDIRATLEGEVTGPAAESLRIAFRVSYGILDKIASSVTDLFEMAPPRSPIYFESFWKRPGKRGGESCWPELESMAQFPLIGLLSLATDLDRKTGEWATYKTWRNALEHRGLILFGDAVGDNQELCLEDRFSLASLDDFTQQSLRLLQVVAGAIINYVLCIRNHMRRDES